MFDSGNHLHLWVCLTFLDTIYVHIIIIFIILEKFKSAINNTV